MSPAAGVGGARAAVRLPPAISACLFDLDGVLTQTAALHGAAWREMFDAYLRERTARGDRAHEPFDLERDYRQHVDGRHREDGVRAFLASRGIELPSGTPDDPPDAETVHGLGNRKNALVLALMRERGVETFEGSVRFLHTVRDAGLATAVVSASANCEAVLEAAGLTGLFEAVVDGVVARREGCAGSPHRTRTSLQRSASTSKPRRPRSSRTRFRASRPVAPAASASSSASIAAATPLHCGSTAPTSSSPTWRNCSTHPPERRRLSLTSASP